MFDAPFDFFALVIAIVAFIFARKAMNQVAELRTRLEAIRTTPAAAAAAVPPPLTPFEAFERTLPPASPAAAPDTTAHRSRCRIRRLRCAEPRHQSRPQAAAAPPPPLPQPDRGFEETVGTRWVVWIGGLTLALGGFFMVRYSIEAGLLGPGVRTMLGGLFALALLLAGEWTRRKESISAIEATADRQYPGYPDGCRNGGGVRHGLCGLCAVRLSGAGNRVHPAGTGGARHACRRAAARAGARRSRRRRRLRHARPGLVRQAGLLGALHLSRHRHRGSLRSGARPAVALARGHHDRVRAVVDVPLPAMRTVDGRPACLPCPRRFHPRRIACGVRRSCSARRRSKARSSRSRPAHSRHICSAPR